MYTWAVLVAGTAAEEVIAMVPMEETPQIFVLELVSALDWWLRVEVVVSDM